MKRIIITSALAMLCCHGIGLRAQSSNQNYIQTKTMRDASGSLSLDVVQYYDGLGRPVEQVLKKHNPNGYDIVSRQEYDAFGRESRSWLPIGTGNTDGRYCGPYGPANFYKDEYGNWDQRPYSETTYEPSPLSRVHEQYGPGSEWKQNSRAVKTAYLTNNSDKELRCAYYGMSGDNLLRNGDYGASQLYVTRTTDENNNVSYEFRDKLDQVILQRRISGTGEDRCHDTYYVYDDYGNLRFVLPPLAADAITTNGTYSESYDPILKYAYLYRYDSRRRCTQKKLPGVGWQHLVYDRSDRLVYSQDGEQRATGKWKYYKYDIHGRLVMTGIKSLNTARTTLESQLRDALVVEQPGTALLGYTNTGGITAVNSELLEVHYYDNYNSLPYSGNLGFQQVTNYDARFTSSQGLPTASLYRELGNPGNEVAAGYYYDSRGRLVQKRTRNHLGGFDCESYKYDFTGQPLQKHLSHSTPYQSALTEEYRYRYDDAGRLKNAWHRINGGTERLLSELGYDHIGRLTTRNTGGVENSTYEYNQRGWLRKMNGSKLSLEYCYVTNPVGWGVNYNGNISAAFWDQPGVERRGFVYAYDPLDRLTNSTYGEGLGLKNQSKSYGEHIAYDKHGNLSYLIRNGMKNNGTTGGLDNIQVQAYNGNQITHTFDHNSAQYSYNILEYHNGYWDLPDYSYDQNGNMLEDQTKDISKIEYNCLNLPKKVSFKTGDWIEYRYDASGAKLASRNYSASKGLTTTRDYVGNKVYDNNALKMVLTEGGYAEKNGNAYSYFFYLKDHQGNNRMVVNASGGVVQAQNYYAFGLPMWEGTMYPSAQPYKFNGKELDRLSGVDLYDYGARYYDAAFARFTTMDPMAENHYDVSPYVYCLNNPLKYVDPTGRDTTYANLNGDIYVNRPGGENIVVVSESLPEVTVTAQRPKSNANKVLEGTMAVAGIMVADDVTGIGAANDPLIPPVIVTGAVVAAGVAVYDAFAKPSAPTLIAPNTFDLPQNPNMVDEFAHEKKKQSTGKSGSDRHDAQYTHGGKNRPENPNKKRGADERRNKGRKTN